MVIGDIAPSSGSDASSSARPDSLAMKTLVSRSSRRPASAWAVASRRTSSARCSQRRRDCSKGTSGGSANAIAFPSGSGIFTWRTPFE